MVVRYKCQCYYHCSLYYCLSVWLQRSWFRGHSWKWKAAMLCRTCRHADILVKQIFHQSLRCEALACLRPSSLHNTGSEPSPISSTFLLLKWALEICRVITLFVVVQSFPGCCITNLERPTGRCDVWWVAVFRQRWKPPFFEKKSFSGSLAIFCTSPIFNRF